MNVSRLTVTHWIKRHKETGNINRKDGSGRKKISEMK